ncbi:hypothetical protein ACA086_08405 [Muriicola sp. E247]|uniref:HYC_CC_PP family protein n=1 Tax=Muriicola sp. E247 TaxID=3242730 RepID=UPI003526B38D
MALVVLFSTFSFALEQHYCCDVLVDFSFFGEAESCDMDGQNMMYSDASSLSKKDCCDDELLAVDGQDKLNISFENLNFEQLQFFASFVFSYLNFFEGLTENIVSFSDYPPPLLVKDILILDQTFLI